jgi:tetratricopeptide (TPR) repeat protein
MEVSATRVLRPSDRRRTALAATVLLAGLCLTAASGCSDLLAVGRNSQGVRLYDRGQYQEAIQEFQEATYSDPNGADGYYNLGATYHRLGKLRNQPDYLARAETCYRQCLDRDPNHRDCHRGLAVLLAEQGRVDEAFRSIQTWADQHPSSSAPKFELARLHEEFGNKSAAKERLVEAITANPTDSRQWAALGKLREETGEYSQALTDYQRSLQIDPSQADVANRVTALQCAVARQTAPTGQTMQTAAQTGAAAAAPLR